MRDVWKRHASRVRPVKNKEMTTNIHMYLDTTVSPSCAPQLNKEVENMDCFVLVEESLHQSMGCCLHVPQRWIGVGMSLSGEQ